jgi:TonB family protein
MALSGNTGELSLADLILVKATDSRSYRLSLSGPSGDGLMFIEAGQIVHATYGELPPEDAAYLLVTEQDVEFEVESDVDVSAHTLELGPQELLMEAMRRLDEGQLRKPRPVPFSLPGSAVSHRREPPRPRSYEARRSPEAEALRRAMGRVIFADLGTGSSRSDRSHLPIATAILIVLALIALGLTVTWRLGWLEATEHRLPVQISDLQGPRDVLPMLRSGLPPAVPDGAGPYLPTILLRILIDPAGRVREAIVAHPDEALADFERAALQAVESYHFSPARREDVIVPVWVDWPVTFAARATRRIEPVPVEAAYFKPDRDRLPSLVEGQQPRTPFPERPARPVITCRLLVDETGGVSEAKVLDPREDQKLYEEVALETVKGYRFAPGEREGVKVPTWVTWKVEFR